MQKKSASKISQTKQISRKVKEVSPNLSKVSGAKDDFSILGGNVVCTKIEEQLFQWSFAFEFPGFTLTPINSKQNSVGVN